MHYQLRFWRKVLHALIHKDDIWNIQLLLWLWLFLDSSIPHHGLEKPQCTPPTSQNQPPFAPEEKRRRLMNGEIWIHDNVHKMTPNVICKHKLLSKIFYYATQWYSFWTTVHKQNIPKLGTLPNDHRLYPQRLTAFVQWEWSWRRCCAPLFLSRAPSQSRQKSREWSMFCSSAGNSLPLLSDPFCNEEIFA